MYAQLVLCYLLSDFIYVAKSGRVNNDFDKTSLETYFKTMLLLKEYLSCLSSILTEFAFSLSTPYSFFLD